MTSLEIKKEPVVCTGGDEDFTAAPFVLAAVPDKRPVFLPCKYASILITIAYETNIYKAARLPANELEIRWRVLQK